MNSKPSAPQSTPFQMAQAWAHKVALEVRARKSTGSTNDDAKTETHEGLTLYLADSQTAGRGRGQNKWLAQSGEALLSSWTQTLKKPPQPILSQLVGLALYRSAHATWPAMKLALKAPNDLCVVKNGKASKLAGLLIEIVTHGPHHRLVVGLGLNVLGAPKIEESSATYPATSLTAEGSLVDESSVFQFLNNFYSELSQVLALSSKAEFKTLDSKQRSELKSALVVHPQFSDLVDVSENGDLVRKNGVTSWIDL